MRRIIATLIALGAVAGQAMAACGGEDLMERIARERPAEHAAIVAKAAAVPNGEARLWRVEREGRPVSWLFGTYHDTASIETLTPAVEAAFAAADSLVVELSDAEMARLEQRIASDPSFTFNFEGSGIAAALDPADLARAEAVLARRGLTVEIAERMQPWMFFAIVGIPACQAEAMAAGGEVMDQALMARARAAGKPVTGLETYEEALGAFDAVEPAIAAEVASDLLRLAEREEDLRRTMLTLYAAGDLGGIDAFNDWLSTQASGRPSAEAERLAAAFEAKLLDGRNRNWMPPLLAALETKSAFVAVGGLHLPGEAGLVALLRDAGFRVTPVAE